MARPKKQPHERRSESLHAEVTIAEKEHARELRRMAGGISEAELVRRSVFDAEIKVVAQADAGLISELNRIGNNINQIARNLNSNRRERLEVEVVLAELRGVLEKVASSYGA